MTAQTVAAQPASQSKSLTPISWKFPIVYTILAVVSLVFFGIIGRDGETTFRIATSGDLFAIPDVVVSSTVAGLVLSLILVVMAAASIYFATKRVALDSWFPMVFGILFVVSFLAWAGGGSGGVIPLTTLLAGALALSVPLIFGAMCGLVGERSGIINIAIEGQLLAGAFLAAVVASVAKNPYAGLLAAPIAGALVAVVLTFFAVKYWVNQIIIGVVLNVLVVGVTSFLYSTVLSENPGLWNARQQLPNLPVPLLSDIPVLGRVLFDQNILVYIMYVVVIALQIF
ncbi:MAG: ABC transporter permease, partial [Brevibacterium aurantiacum]|nr:ABC transporter permease [Brevibacterium aurantiacum]